MITISREKVGSAAAKQMSEEDAMYHIALSLVRSLKLEEMYQTIVQVGTELTQTPHGFIYVVNEHLEKLELKYGMGVYQRYQGVARNKDEPSVSSTVWKTGQPLLVGNIQQWQTRATDRPYGWDIIHSVLGIPLRSDYGVTAVVGLGFSTKNRTFSAKETDLLERFETLATLSLHNAKVHSALHKELMEKKLIRLKQTPNPPDLTDREKSVLIRMATGLSNRDIAKDMGVEISTVKTHAHHLFGKLEVGSRAQALMKAWEFGLLGDKP